MLQDLIFCIISSYTRKHKNEAAGAVERRRRQRRGKRVTWTNAAMLVKVLDGETDTHDHLRNVPAAFKMVYPHPTHTLPPHSAPLEYPNQA